MQSATADQPKPDADPDRLLVLVRQCRDGLKEISMQERGRLISRLQGVAQSKSVRVTFVSGDVHVGGLGRLYSSQKLDLRQDFRYMPQVSLLWLLL